MWQLLLRVREAVGKQEAPCRFFAFSTDDPSAFWIDRLPEDGLPRIWVAFDEEFPVSIGPADTLFRCFGLLDYRLERRGRLSDQQAGLLQQYLPYCFLRYFALQKGRAITVAHFAQSLDGKIATLSGHSRWIGNEANLEHAHRMRALCDGILIGNNTLINDRPQLTVRRVAGPNPVRIVIGSRVEDCSCLLKASLETIVVIRKKGAGVAQEADPRIRQVVYDGKESFIPCRLVLEKLFRQGINSILVEGGATTTSRFLHEDLLDLLQLHIAPILMGSGRDSFKLPEISLVNHATTFRTFFFQPVANAYMFVGQPECSGNDPLTEPE